MCHSEVQSFTPALPVCTRAKIIGVAEWNVRNSRTPESQCGLSVWHAIVTSGHTNHKCHWSRWSEHLQLCAFTCTEKRCVSWRSSCVRALCLGVTDVTTLCNSAPRLLLGHSHLLTEAQRSHKHTYRWCCALTLHLSHLAQVNSCWNLFFLSFFFLCHFCSQCLFQPFSACHGSWCQHTERLALPRWRDQQSDGDR